MSTYGDRSSVGRAPGCDSGCCGFESRRSPFLELNKAVRLDSTPRISRLSLRGEVAQLVEHSTENAGVAGSIPALGTSAASGSSSVVEHFLAKEDVAGSNPVSRSTNPSKLIAILLVTCQLQLLLLETPQPSKSLLTFPLRNYR